MFIRIIRDKLKLGICIIKTTFKLRSEYAGVQCNRNLTQTPLQIKNKPCLTLFIVRAEYKKCHSSTGSIVGIPLFLLVCINQAHWFNNAVTTKVVHEVLLSSYGTVLSFPLVAFTKTGGFWLKHNVWDAFSFQSHLQIMHLTSIKRISVSTHESSHWLKLHFPNAWLDASLSAFLNFGDTIAMLHQSITVVTQFHLLLARMFTI